MFVPKSCCLKVLALFFLLGICLGSPPVLLADEDDDVIDDISLGDLLNIEVEVASTKAETVFNTPSTVTVVDRATLERYNFLNIGEAVNTVAGMNVLHTHYLNNIPTSRGLLQYYYANKVLIMINGVPSWMSVQGQGILNRVDIHDVERIEVLKGPASVLYGTNAYNGAINIVLRESEEDEISGHAGVGDRNFFTAGSRITYRKDDFSLTVSGNLLNEKRDAYDFTDNNGYTFPFEEEERSNNVNLIARYGAHSLMFNTYDMSDPCIGVFYRYDDGVGTTDLEGMLLNYRFDKALGDDWRILGNAFLDRNELRHPLFGLDYTVDGERAGGNLKVLYDVTDKLSVETGAEYNHSESNEYVGRDPQGNIIRDVGPTGKSVDEFSVFAQANYRHRNLNCLFGTRYTDNELFGDNLSSRVSAVLTLSENNSLKFIFGQSFRSPSFMEIYMSGANIRPNEDLQPETNTSYEIAYLTKWERLFFQVTGYYAKYDDLIKRVPVPGAADRRYENAYSLEGYGAEMELKYQNPELINAFVNYSLVLEGDNEEEVESDPFYNYKFFPRHTVNFGLNKSLGRFFLSANGAWFSEVDGPYEEIGSQFLLDAHVGFTHTMHEKFRVRHTLSAKNLTDSDTLMPEYIRQMGTVNALPTTGYGRRFVYTISFAF